MLIIEGNVSERGAPPEDQNQAGWLHAKFVPPEPARDLVARVELNARLLHEVQSRRLTLISAPAGAGKTSAVLALRQAHPELPLVWISIDRGDQDAAAFARLIVQAIRQEQPGFGKQSLALLGGASGQSPAPVLLAGALCNDLHNATGGPLTLVLDDLHRADSAEIYELLDHLLERAPETVHFVATSRHDPPLRLGQLRVRGQLAEFRQADLQLNPQEIAEVVKTAAAYQLPAQELQLVHERTQGWAAGVRLVALSLRQRKGDAQRTDLVHRLAASQRLLFDYLVEEVLDSAQAEERAFLLQASVLERLTPEVCDAITGRNDSAVLLSRLYRQNYFLTFTEGEAEPDSYSFHPLFAQFLQKQLRHSGEWDYGELHRRAAAAARTREQRIEHWLAAESWADAIPIIVEIGQEQCERSYVSPQTMDWLVRISGEARAGHYWLDLIEANYARQKGLQQQCVTHSLAAMTAAQAAGDTLAVLEGVWNLHFFGQEDLWSQGMEEVMAKHARISPARKAHYLVGQTWMHLNKYNWPEVDHYLQQYLDTVEQAGSADLYYAAAQHIGPQMLFADGGLQRMREFDNRALSLAGEGAGLQHAGPYIRRGWTALLECDLDAADKYAQMASEIFEEIGHFAYIDLMLDYLRFNLMLSRGDYAELEAFVQEDEARLHAVETHRENVPAHLLCLWRAQWAQDKLQDAGATAQRLIPIMDASAAEWELASCKPLVLGWQAHAEGDLAAAEQHLAEAASRHRRARWVGTWGNAELDLALFYVLSQQPAKALAAWDSAAAGMQRRNMPGEAVLCGPRLLPLLELARQEGRHADLAARALAALEGEERGGSILLQNGQSLTPREAEVLQLLVQGASNQDIADKLVISLRTAKAHVSSILSKLQVSTRSEAIARSHELALLSSPRSR